MLEDARSRLKTWLVAGIGTAAAIVVASVMGAFGTRHEPLPALAPAGPIEAGQWFLRPIEAYVAEGGSLYGVPLKPGARALVFEVEMTNRTAKSTKDYFDVLQAGVTTADPAAKPFVVLTRDSTLSPELHPGMPERMAYIWQLPDGAALPASLDLTVVRKIYKQRDNLYGLPGWFNPAPAGRLEIPLATGPGKAGARP